jgi:hypothetical protein
VFEVAAADNQQSVEALAPNGSDPALGVRPRLRRLHRRFDHPYDFAAEDLIEVTRELAVAITDETPRPDAFVAKIHQQVARLLGHQRPSGLVVIPAKWTRRVASSMKKST